MTAHVRACAYLDGALDADGEKTFLDHIAACAMCIQELHDELQLRDREDEVHDTAAGRTPALCGRAGDYLAGTLDAAAEVAFLEHLAACPSCANELHDSLQFQDREDAFADLARSDEHCVVDRSERAVVLDYGLACDFGAGGKTACGWWRGPATRTSHTWASAIMDEYLRERAPVSRPSAMERSPDARPPALIERPPEGREQPSRSLIVQPRSWMARLRRHGTAKAAVLAGVTIATTLIDQRRLDRTTIDAARTPIAVSQQGGGAPTPITDLAGGSTSPEHRAAIRIKITSPPNDSVVQEITDVGGEVSDPDATVWVVIKPSRVSDCWIQTMATVDPDGRWSVTAHFGDAGTKAERFDIVAIADPKDEIGEGKARCWPAAAARSGVVRVTR